MAALREVEISACLIPRDATVETYGGTIATVHGADGDLLLIACNAELIRHILEALGRGSAQPPQEPPA